MKRRIYLDNNASTAIDPRLLDVFINDLKESIGNPSSIHSFGQESRQKLIKARQAISAYLGVKPHEIIFTSGGTEGANLLLRGLFPQGKKGHIISSSIEHSCVYATLKSLEGQGCRVSFLNPGPFGAVTPEAVQEGIRPDTSAIVLMAVNNETGVKTDIEGIAGIAQEAGIPFVVDGVAQLGKEAFKIPAGVSAVFFSGHKVHTPKGVGFVYVRSNLKLAPLLTGGEQEYTRRGGTENLPGICALAEGVGLLKNELPAASLRMAELRDFLEQGLIQRLEGVAVNGQGPRICNTTNLAFSGVDGEALLASLDMEGIAVSHGSACSSGALEPSRILLNMGISRAVAATSLRFSLSRFTTRDEIEACIDAAVRIVQRLRKLKSS